jgi:hypothetical protein
MMKTQNIFLRLGLLLFMTMIAGCAQSTEKAATPDYPATSVSKMETITPTLAPIVTDTPTPTTTPTAIPTLSVEEAGKRLLDLLSNNGGCRLPCLWGITPGKSAPQDAQTLWSPLSGISSRILTLPSYFAIDEGDVYPAYVEGDLMLMTDASYQSNNQIISRIIFYARERKKFVPSTGGWGLLDIYDSTTFGKRVEYYSLAHLLSEQGIPNSVLIMTSGFSIYHPQTIGGFEIILSYPEEGIWARYTTQVEFFVSGKVQGCPANAHIEMDLYPPGNANAFSNSIGKTHPEISDGWYKPIQEVTSMSLQQFYETFRQPTNKCIETPAKLWPTPESGGG